MLRQIVSRAPRLTRNVSYTVVRLAATNMAMPAMSPTMTEGGIVEWKIKEGDSFAAGDVLLEVETDKAQIDVEAQDDGILAKIYVQAGEKGIPVGKSIAVIAEPGDDISSLELPAQIEGGQKSEEPTSKQEVTSSQSTGSQQTTPPVAKPATSKSSTSSASTNAGKANPGQTLLPSVSTLLHQNDISKSDALAKIPASGPNGRLIKGDVLAYLGAVPQDTLQAVQAQINKLAYLDLSNIKVREEPKPEQKSDKSAQEKARQGPIAIEKVFDLEDLALLKTTVDATFSSTISVERLVEKASKLALRDVANFSQPRPSRLYDPIFEQLIAPPKGTRSFDISLSYSKKPSFSSLSSSSTDIYSILASSRKPLVRPSGSSSAVSDLKVSVTPNPRVPNSNQKANAYLDRLGYYLSHANGELVL
jgi:Biotin-requiring enzyme/e3 binding domain